MNASAKSDVNAFEKSVTSAHSFVGKLDRSRVIISGYQGFISKLEDEISQVRDVINQYEQLNLKFEGGELKERYQKPLQAEIKDLERLVESAKKILREVNSSDKIRRLTDQRFDLISRQINVLLFEEGRRRINNLRVQGPKVREVQKKLPQASLYSGSLAEAYTLLVGLIARSQLDPHSQLTGIEGWMSEDNSIWLYHHSKVEKWKCLFFRLSITRIAEDLNLSLEAYVPFGFGNDPANYELESSDTFVRAGWRFAETLTKSLNQSRSFNLNVSSSRAFGVTLGSSVTVTEGSTETTGTSVTDSTSRGTNENTSRAIGETKGTTDTIGKSVGHSSSWFDNWSESTGYSTNWSSGPQGSSFGGGDTSTVGRGGGQSYGQTETDSSSTAETNTNSVTDTTGFGKNESVTKALGTNESTSVNTSLAAQRQRGASDTKTTTRGEGITMGDGESIQIAFKAFGIALGKPVSQHLEKWKEANGDASRVFDSVFSAFETWSNRIEASLKTMSRGGTKLQSGDLKQRLPEIAKYIPLENLGLARVVEHQEGGAAAAISETLKPEARHGQFGLEHLPANAGEEPGVKRGASGPDFPALPPNTKSIVPNKL